MHREHKVIVTDDLAEDLKQSASHLEHWPGWAEALGLESDWRGRRFRK